MTATSATLPAGIASLPDLYRALDPLSIGAGWNKPTPSLYPVPKKTYEPMRWRYADARAALEIAGRLVDTELAERRNLIMINPIGGNAYATAATLVSAYQMILPGERARSHRHTPNALRLIVESDGGYTTVDGVRVPMEPGDVVLTPSWSWHGHGNDGSSAAIWIDYLDVPLVHLLEPMFFENHPADYETVTRIDLDSPLLYRWADLRTRLAGAPLDPSGRFGRQIALDRYPLHTIGLFMSAFDAGTTTADLRTTANNIYSVVRGRGFTVIDGQTLSWEPGDTLVAPAWRPHHHHADDDAVLFRVTDEPLLAATGWLRTAEAAS